MFDSEGKIYGMQVATRSLHLGFDINEHEIRTDEGKKKKVSNFPFLHLGRCIHMDVIKSFLKEHNVKYYPN